MIESVHCAPYPVWCKRQSSARITVFYARVERSAEYIPNQYALWEIFPLTHICVLPHKIVKQDKTKENKKNSRLMYFLHDKCYTFSIKYQSYHMLIDYIQLFSRVFITKNIGTSWCNSVGTICKFTPNGRSFLVNLYRYISWYFRCAHYSGVTRSAISSQITFQLFTQPFFQAQIKEHIKAPHHWPLWV